MGAGEPPGGGESRRQPLSVGSAGLRAGRSCIVGSADVPAFSHLSQLNTPAGSAFGTLIPRCGTGLQKSETLALPARAGGRPGLKSR